MSKRREDEPTNRLEERVAATVRRLVRALSRAPASTPKPEPRAGPGELQPSWRQGSGGDALETIYPFLQREAALAFIRQVSQRSRAEGWQAELSLEPDFSVRVRLLLDGSGEVARRLDELYGWDTWR